MKAMTISKAALAAVFLSGLAGLALAQQEAPTGTPPSWQTLVRCAEMANDDASLACFKAAMREAGFAPKPEAVAEEHRKHFGLSLPKLGMVRRHERQEGAQAGGEPGAVASAPAKQVNEDEANVTLSKVAVLYDGKLLFITTDGAIWEQTDDTTVEPRPKEGMSMRIHKGAIGGFFCDASQYKSVRCQRTR